jgi:hypothetical protein
MGKLIEFSHLLLSLSVSAALIVFCFWLGVIVVTVLSGWPLEGVK